MNFTAKNLLLAGFFLAFFLFIGNKMGKTGLNPGEVVGFEFSYFTKTTGAIVTEWGARNPDGHYSKLDALASNTKLDFLYIIGYVFFGVFLARVAAGEGQLLSAKRIALLLFIAGACDVVENLQILQIIHRDFGLRPMVMSFCAALKFGLLAVSLTWAAALFAKRRKGRAFNSQ